MTFHRERKSNHEKPAKCFHALFLHGFFFTSIFGMSNAALSTAESPVFTVDTRAHGVSEIITLDTRSGYTLWAESLNLTGSNALPDATAHSDGVTNLLKYAFNMNGAGPDTHILEDGESSGLPSFEMTNHENSKQLQLRVIRRKNDPAIEYIAEFSSNTTDWLTTPPPQPFEITPLNQIWERVTYRDPEIGSAVNRRFARVRVVYNH